MKRQQRPGVRRLLLARAQLLRFWKHELRDERQILEQDGDLRYLIVTVGIQRLAILVAIRWAW